MTFDRSGREGFCATSRAFRSRLPPAKDLFGSLAAVVCLATLVSCGVQGPPRPPRIQQPEQVKDLKVIQRGRTFELSFTAPALATDGERLSKPIELEIFRAVTPRGEKPTERPASAPWMAITASDLARYSQDNKIVFSFALTDQELAEWPGATFTFGVRALTRGFRKRPVESEISNVVQATVFDVALPVEILEIRTTEKALEIRWSSPTQSLTGMPVSNVAGYRIFRSDMGTPGSFQLRAETVSASYSDTEYAFDHDYYYKVRSFVKEGNRTAESEDSAIKEITPRDTFPPAAPTELNAVYATGMVELTWKANVEPDLAGYIVFRWEEGGNPRQLNAEPVPVPIYRDSSVEAGRQYFYRVTAVDRAHNESAPSEQAAVETR